VRPADRVVVVGLRADEVVDPRREDSGVSSAPNPPSVIISLKVPCSEPSAEAPLSPMITYTRVSPRIPRSSSASISSPT
jgi:hypothetical protein